MRTTLTLDDELLAQAQQFSGLTERTQLIREALVQRESARRLAPCNYESAYAPTH